MVRTITQREKKHERFSPMESERLYRVVRVRALAREIFSADAAVAEWMSVADRSLGNRTPLEMLATDLGVQKVESLLRAMMPLKVRPLPLGHSAELKEKDPVVIVGHGGRGRVARAEVVSRRAFAGSWEYLLDEAHHESARRVGDKNKRMATG